LATRRAAGQIGNSNVKILVYLDRFLISEIKPGETITEQIAERWFQSSEHLHPGTRINRMSVLRQFCHYLSHFDRRTCIVHRSFLPTRTRPAPHIYSKLEVTRIITAALRLGPAGSLRPVTISTLIGFLYTTGLRIGEALKLKVSDVDLKRGVLLIRETKFKKTRQVPLSASCVANLKHYLEQRREAGMDISASLPFFVGNHGRKCSHTAITTVFLEIVRELNIRGPRGQRGPRIHDFRHTFAVNRLSEWYREEVNLYAKLPLLSTYLGHSTVTSTEIYLHATAELLEGVGKRFHSHFAVPPIKRAKLRG